VAAFYLQYINASVSRYGVRFSMITIVWSTN